VKHRKKTTHSKEEFLKKRKRLPKKEPRVGEVGGTGKPIVDIGKLASMP